VQGTVHLNASHSGSDDIPPFSHRETPLNLGLRPLRKSRSKSPFIARAKYLLRARSVEALGAKELRTAYRSLTNHLECFRVSVGAIEERPVLSQLLGPYWEGLLTGVMLTLTPSLLGLCVLLRANSQDKHSVEASE
jgi:hypothetical protein